MDNASKALIMAGAILIAVAIVGIGIYIFSAANSMTDDALNQIDALTVTSINSQLHNYEGDIRGRELKQLINTARSINMQETLPDGAKIGFTTDGKVSDKASEIDGSQPDVSQLLDNHTYHVTFGYSTAGYINCIAYKDNSVKAELPGS